MDHISKVLRISVKYQVKALIDFTAKIKGIFYNLLVLDLLQKWPNFKNITRESLKYVRFTKTLIVSIYVKIVHIRGFSGPHFFRFRTEYGNLLCKFPYSVRMRENTDQKTPITDTFQAVSRMG